MERYETLQKNAKKNLQVADHMVNVTYRLVRDPKLLLAVMERLMSALTDTMASLLYYERQYKRIPAFQENFEAMFSLFKARCTRRYNINIEYITIIQEVKDILRQHKESPIEFRKDDKFVICTDNYRMRVIAIDNIRKYVAKAKLFLKETENMVNLNGRTT